MFIQSEDEKSIEDKLRLVASIKWFLLTKQCLALKKKKRSKKVAQKKPKQGKL